MRLRNATRGVKINVKCGQSYVLVPWAGERPSPVGTSASNWPIVPDLDDEYGAFGGMRISEGNRSTRRKPTPVPLCLPQIPHDLTLYQTRAAAVRNRRLTVCAVAQATTMYSYYYC
jgi:hypothetical protein